MKKYFVLLALAFAMLSGASSVNAQSKNSTTLNKGVVVDGDRKFCTYEKSCLITMDERQHWIQELEIGWDRLSKTYSIYINVRGDINLEVKWESSGKETHTYVGKDRITGRKVSVITRQKLSSYLNNNGVNSEEDVKAPYGIVIVIPSTQVIFSLVPIKNK